MVLLKYIESISSSHVNIDSKECYEANKCKLGYYYIFDATGLFNPFINDSIKIIKFTNYQELNVNISLIFGKFGNTIAKRIRASQVGFYLPKNCIKNYYALELDTTASFKNKKQIWVKRSFSSNLERKFWVSECEKNGSTVKSVSFKNRLKNTLDSKTKHCYAGYNAKGVSMPPEDNGWQVYRFDSRILRNKWLKNKNYGMQRAVMLFSTEVFKYAHIKHDMPIKTDSTGLILSESQNRRTISCRKYYIGVNRLGLDRLDCDSNWEIYAAESMKKCKELISDFNIDGVERAKKINRIFAYKVLGLDVFDQTYLSSEFRVQTFSKIETSDMAA